MAHAVRADLIIDDEARDGPRPRHPAILGASTVRLESTGLAQLAEALEHGALRESFARACAAIGAIRSRVIVTGMGKSGHVGRKIAATLTSTGTPAVFLHPAEASHGDLGMITPDDLLLVLSWSGETRELGDVINYARRFSVPLIAVTAVANSALGRAADICLTLPKVAEACPNRLAPTSSSTVQAALGDALAVVLIEQRGFCASDFHRFHPGGMLGAQLLKVRDLMATGDALPTVGGDATIREATEEMTRKRFGVTAVVDRDRRLCGVFTDGDLRRSIGVAAVDAPVREHMTTTPITMDPDAPATAALKRMNDSKISLLFVVDDGRVVGLVHIHEVLRAGVA